jgi:hypothetical protein
MTRVTVNLTPEQAQALKDRARETGVPQSEQIRRAIASSFSGPAPRPSQPVLFVTKKAGE